MRHLFSQDVPPFSRVLLVESGSRKVLEDFLSGIYDFHPNMKADLVTCYGGVPEHFRTDAGEVYRVTDYPGPKLRKHLFKQLAANRYTIVGMICSDEPIMTKWKWALAARLPGKVFVLNENCDYFWLDCWHWRVILHFALFRAGLTGSGAVRTPARLVLIPFALLYLILYALIVHLRRKLRTL
ncbi:MAG TPA: hypothetical protein VEV17_14135 [Bryobacteraceae bacterium]|nr:hypothetical protein [Bryobacteraceae bacterium]